MASDCRFDSKDEIDREVLATCATTGSTGPLVNDVFGEYRAMGLPISFNQHPLPLLKCFSLLLCLGMQDALQAQVIGQADLDPLEFADRIEMQFGVHTNSHRVRSWNVAIKLISPEGHEHLALHDAESAFTKVAARYIQQLQQTQCLSSEQIAKLKLAARLQAHEVVRKSEAFLQQANQFPIEKQSNAELAALAGQFRIDHGGELFTTESLFARTWNTIVHPLE